MSICEDTQWSEAFFGYHVCVSITGRDSSCLMLRPAYVHLEVVQCLREGLPVEWEVSTAVERCQDYSSFYIGKHLFGAGLHLCWRLSPLSPWPEARRQAGQHGDGEGAEHSTSGSTGNRKEKESLGLA